jgi:hypothetical protein
MPSSLPFAAPPPRGPISRPFFALLSVGSFVGRRYFEFNRAIQSEVRGDGIRSP